MCFGLEILGAVVAAAGSIASGMAAKQQADYNAQVAKINAETARQQGQYEADRIGDKYDALKSQQRVAALKSGVDPGYGSAALIINGETERNSWLDQMTTVWNRETEAVGFENKAKAFKAEGKAKMVGSVLSAGSSLIGGMGKAGYMPKIA